MLAELSVTLAELGIICDLPPRFLQLKGCCGMSGWGSSFFLAELGIICDFPPGYLVSLVKLSIDVGRRKKMETCVLCFISSERFASAGMAMTVNTQHIPYYS